MNLSDGAREALDAFAACSGWEQRARLLMQWGEHLEPLDEAERSEANRVNGCESQVWLVGERLGGRWVFRASSDARLLRGLLALLLVRIEGLDAQTLTSLDVAGWFAQLGLSRQLSPSRSNGLNAVVQQMRRLTEQT